MGKFNGIDTFHDGLAVSDYVNMVPLGDSCIDRLGEQVVSSLAFTTAAKVRGHFVDSAKRIYIVLADMVHVFEPSDESYTYAGVMAGLIDGEPVTSFRLIGKSGPLASRNHPIKPSTVYLCDGFCIYKWDSTGSQALLIRTMLPPNVFPALPEEWEAARAIDPVRHPHRTERKDVRHFRDGANRLYRLVRQQARRSAEGQEHRYG